LRRCAGDRQDRPERVILVDAGNGLEVEQIEDIRSERQGLVLGLQELVPDVQVDLVHPRQPFTGSARQKEDLAIAVGDVRAEVVGGGAGPRPIGGAQVDVMPGCHGNVAGAKEYRNCQFMTPETERTTHFFWTYLNNFEGADSTISRSLLDSLIEGFMEDKEIIERQQKTLDEDPSFQMLAILADAPLAHFRRLLGKLIDAERGGAANQSAEPRAPTTPPQEAVRG